MQLGHLAYHIHPSFIELKCFSPNWCHVPSAYMFGEYVFHAFAPFSSDPNHGEDLDNGDDLEHPFGLLNRFAEAYIRPSYNEVS